MAISLFCPANKIKKKSHPCNTRAKHFTIEKISVRRPAYADIQGCSRSFPVFLDKSSYLEVVPCRWGYVRLFNEGDPINFGAILCQKPEDLYQVLSNDLETELDAGRRDD